MKKTLTLLLTALMLMSLLTGCGNRPAPAAPGTSAMQETQAKTETAAAPETSALPETAAVPETSETSSLPETGAEPETSAEPETPETMEVTDMKGRTVTLPADIQRVVVTFNMEEYFAVAGDQGIEKLAGWSHKYWEGRRQDAYDAFTAVYPRLADIPDVGSVNKAAVLENPAQFPFQALPAYNAWYNSSALTLPNILFSTE